MVTLGPNTNLSVQSQYINWANYKFGKVYNALSQAQQLNRWLLLTIEPWADPTISSDSSTLLADVANGLYDTVLEQIAAEIVMSGWPIFVRWGAEMELPANFGRYPWAGTNPITYVAAYTHVVQLMQANVSSLNQQISYIWSPAGVTAAVYYYPGVSVADYIGVNVYSYEPSDIANFSSGQSFQTLMNARYSMATTCNPTTPIIVAECGVCFTPRF